MATGALRLALLLPSSRSRHPMLLLRAGSDENRSAGFQPAFSLLSACFQPAFSLLSACFQQAVLSPAGNHIRRCRAARKPPPKKKGSAGVDFSRSSEKLSEGQAVRSSSCTTAQLKPYGLGLYSPLPIRRCGRYVCLTCAITLKLLLPHSILTLCAPHRLMSFLESIYQNVNEWNFYHCRSPATTGTPST